MKYTITKPLTFEIFEKAYVEVYGECLTKEQLMKFFNLALKLGLEKQDKK